MTSNINSKQVFFNGQECWQNNDYIKARYWFEISSQDDNFRIASLYKLIRIEIKEGLKQEKF